MRFAGLAVLLCLNFQLLAQQFDTTVYALDLGKYTTYERMESMEFDFLNEDSTILETHLIHPHKKYSTAWLDQGQIMSPGMSLEYSLPSSGTFQQANSPISEGLLKSKDILFYISESARTNLKYSQGSANLIFVEANHSQNIFERWSAGVNYRRIKTQNMFYDNLPEFNQERMTNVFGTQLFTHYVTRNRNYELLADYTWNKSTIQETAGIADVSRYDTLSGRQKLFASSANLANAENFYVDKTLRISQFFRRGERVIDLNDSMHIPDTGYERIKNQWMYDLAISWQANRFTDLVYNPLIYPNRLLGFNTSDSIFQRVISNRFSNSGLANKGRLQYSGELSAELIRIKQLQAHESSYLNIQLSGEVQQKVGFGEMNFCSKWTPLGYNQGDWSIKASLSSPTIDSSFFWYLGVRSLRHRPAYNMQFFGSNYFYWNQRLAKGDIQEISASLGLPSGVLSLNGAFRNIIRYSYVDENGLPNQVNSGFANYSLEINSAINLGRVFHTRQKLIYQYSGSDKLRLPQLIYKTTLYLEGKLFKKNMNAQLGIDGYFYSRFIGYDYDAASRMFKLSNQKTGGYPMIDVFINMHVKTMKLFVVAEHVTQGYFSSDWYSLPGYPMLGTAIRFGADWRLFN